MNRVLVLLLAGGKGSRLEPLTRERAKPAVPFGGTYRIIDFTLSNCINSGLRQIFVLTQYKAASLERHLALGWRFLSLTVDEFIEVLPPQQRVDERWYQGTGDATYQNIYSIEKHDPQFVLILAGDHIYKMDYAAMIRYHAERKASVTVACIPTPLAKAAGNFGVLNVEDDGRIIEFEEKPAHPQPLPGDSRRCLASMGIYVFSASVLYDRLCQDAEQPWSNHDFGKNIIPSMIADRLAVYSYPFVNKASGDVLYWRDVGTLDAYFRASMDLMDAKPSLNISDDDWPIYTHQPQAPPSKFVFAEEIPGARCGQALNSLIAQGCIISGGRVCQSILSPRVRVNSFAEVEESILFEGVDVGRGARIRRAIIDKGVKIPPGLEIGGHPERDRQRGLHVTEGGVTVVAKGETLARFL